MTQAGIYADVPADVYHQFARLQAMTQWWHWLLLVAVCAGVLLFVAMMYRRDAAELGRAKRWALLLLRVAAFVGILFFFLDLEKRSQRQVVKNSRVALLVDTSLSMGIQDQQSGSAQRRIDPVIRELEQGTLLDQLRRRHDVVVYRFDEEAAPVEIASFLKYASASADAPAVDPAEAVAAAAGKARTLALLAGAVLLVAACSFAVYLARRRRRREDETAWSLLVGMVGLLVAGVILSVAHLRYPEVGFLATLGLRPATLSMPAAFEAEDDQQAKPTDVVQIDWQTALAPQGTETRLGDALRTLVRRERDGSMAGVVVITDGGSNAGLDVEQAIAAAQASRIPLFPVGLGGAERPANVRVVDIEAPDRVYPGDSFAINGYIQSFGFPGRTVQIQMRTRPAGGGADAGGVVERRSVRLPEDGEIVPIRFEVVPEAQGEQLYELQVAAPEADHDARDNQRTAKVQVVERKNQVLLMAGGPMRDYRFLRDLLYRDDDTTSHVLLQSGQPGISQEADRLLYEFPSTPEELFEYDCIVAFDADWTALNDAQIQLLERWVSEEAGGLIVVAGPVHTPRWASRVRTDPRIEGIKNLYPVVFYSRGSATLSLGRFASEEAWPLEFTRDGQEAEFLWLEDDPLLNRSAWESFAGVYGYYAVKDPKPGARVFSRFSDPSTAMDGDLPIYMAAHFYGAGRVFFQASGEMWRVRAVNDAFFERYYTKLIRWVSQGRLARDSSRGVLLVDKSRCLLGDQVAVRAILTDAQFQPLVAEQVTAVLVDPNGHRQSLPLERVRTSQRPGTFAGHFTAMLEGDYRVELQPPHGDADELLVRDVQARIPALETERPERDDVLLKQMADQTGGTYFVGLDTALNRSGARQLPLEGQIEMKDQVSYVAGTPDKNFERDLMAWLMGFICGALCLEWLIRRLNRLA